MELKDFIKETMIAIAKGESEASGELSQMGWTTNIQGTKTTIDGMPSVSVGGVDKTTYPLVCVKFGVRVEVDETSKIEGSASAIRVLSVGGNSSIERAETHEVSFSLPMRKARKN